MSRCIAQVSLERKGGLPEDVVTNTFHFEDDPGGGIGVNGDGLAGRIFSFYESIGQSILSSALSGKITTKLYNWEDAKPRVPVKTYTGTIPALGSTLPGEVAVCLSYRAETVSGGLAARRRGRVWLGPCKASILGQGSNDPDGRPNETALVSMLTAARAMAAGGSGAFRLAVYSPTTNIGGGNADAAWNDVIELSADNAFDTMRSRGVAPSKRIKTTLTQTNAPA